MATNNESKRLNYFVGILVFLIIAVSAYITIGDLAGKQSQQHQQSISPVFALVENELLRPLHIAETLAEIELYKEFFIADEPDKEKLVALLDKFNSTFGYEFYLAHDKSRKQYNSNGQVFDLIEGQVIWYFALKDQTDNDIQAVLGKREDVHLYIDVRQYDEQGNFIGFAGLGKSLSDFLLSFEKFRNEYGHEFIFVNNEKQIVLSSISELSPAHAITEDEVIGIKEINQVEWYDEFVNQAGDDVEPSVIVSSETGDLLISKLSLQNLKWNIYILTPLNERQLEVNKSFALYVAIGILILFIAYKVLYKLIDKYMDKVNRRINQDPLTLLANREYARTFFYRERRVHRQMSVIVCDLDRFKNINDQYGHMAGDIVLKKVARTFESVVSKQGLVARWGGEEFAIILPDKDSTEAREVAEKCRLEIERLSIVHKETEITVTGSFGISASRQYADNLEVLVERADRAMYKAKVEGRNTVISG
ncbi:GGDEF domain-containing protein [Glaciecola sp. 1036]|uniref:GGDEF domain-containing protein n=1 Tax=Alteromonadaceae TaxID=72275 RepID=UPI003CFF8A63